MHGRNPAEVAAREAFEEAGLLGKIIGKHPVGIYHYTKRLPLDRDVLCEVQVFLFLVQRQLDDWPEKRERQTRWLDPSDACTLVDEGGLAEIMRRVFGSVRSRAAEKEHAAVTTSEEALIRSRRA
jgi:8-oxo-dGTP pyrophosphatase MutT (NUDIX family)